MGAQSVGDVFSQAPIFTEVIMSAAALAAAAVAAAVAAMPIRVSAARAPKHYAFFSLCPKQRIILTSAD